MLNNQRASPVSVICLGEILYDLIADQSDRSIEQVTSWTTYAGGRRQTWPVDCENWA